MFTGQASEAAMLHADTAVETATRRALVLDADPASIARALAARRVETVTATDGEAGLARLLDELLSLDVLVMALELPGRDARSLTRLIRKAGNEKDLAIVVVADHPAPALRLELRGLGVDAIVDRADGPQAIAAAALDVVRRRREVEEIELEAWRHAPAAGPLGETTWFAPARGELAMMVA